MTARYGWIIFCRTRLKVLRSPRLFGAVKRRASVSSFTAWPKSAGIRCPGGSSLAHNGGRHGAKPELRPGARRSPIQAAAGVAVKWPWRRPEVRSANYTDQVVSRLLAAASAKGDGGALGAIETAARWWGAGLGSARVTPSSSALAAITPSVLDTIGRGLCRAGESLHVIDVRAGRVTLTPCGAWTISGSDDPGSWEYLCTLSGPTSTRTVTRESASVLHVRYSPDPARPWIGRSPMAMALATARVAGLLENATAGELNFTQQQVLTPRAAGATT